jgi:hypothetical protein
MIRRLYSQGTEPNIRAELRKTFDGVSPETPKAQWFILRKMRRDTNGEMIECDCVDKVTHEPDLDHFCPICHGEGNLWDEIFFETYKVVKQSDVGLGSKEVLIAPGIVNVESVVFYTTYEVNVTEDDKVVELGLNLDGSVQLPYKRKKLFRINTLIDLRSDSGKLEYWKLACIQEDRKFLNGVTRE